MLTELVCKKIYTNKPEYCDIRFLKISQGIYISVLKAANNWSEHVWYIEYDGEKITKSIELEVTGQVIKFETIKLNGKDYVEFNVANHQGNGDTVLWNIESKKVEITFDGTIDFYHDGYIPKKILQKYSITANEKEQYNYSLLYQNNYLDSAYIDVDKDGKDDAVFSGMQVLVLDETNEITGVSYIKRVYVYNKESTSYEENKKLSQQIIVNL